MGKRSAPPPPDYTAAAVASGESSREVTDIQNMANRPDQEGPWGSVRWGRESVTDPTTGRPVTKWTQNTILRPELERALTSEVNQQAYRSNLAQSLLGRVNTGLAEEPSFDQFGDIGMLRDEAQDTAYDYQTSRLDRDWSEKENDLTIALRNKGLRPGTEAYDREYRNFSEARNDAYSQARAQSIAEGRAESQLAAALRGQGIQEYLLERQTPLNEVNALMTGQQVQQPQFQSFNQATRAAPVDFLGASQAGYGASIDGWNIDNANRQGTMNGMFSLGRAAMGFM